MALVFYTTYLRLEYSWLEETFETDMIGAYRVIGMFEAIKEHHESQPVEYILNSAPATMGIAVRSMTSGIPDRGLLDQVLDWFQAPAQQRRYTKFTIPRRIWYTDLVDRVMEARIKQHNMTTANLLSEEPITVAH